MNELSPINIYIYCKEYLKNFKNFIRVFYSQTNLIRKLLSKFKTYFYTLSLHNSNLMNIIFWKYFSRNYFHQITEFPKTFLVMFFIDNLSPMKISKIFTLQLRNSSITRNLIIYEIFLDDLIQ